MEINKANSFRAFLLWLAFPQVCGNIVLPTTSSVRSLDSCLQLSTYKEPSSFREDFKDQPTFSKFVKTGILLRGASKRLAPAVEQRVPNMFVYIS